MRHIQESILRQKPFLHKCVFFLSFILFTSQDSYAEDNHKKSVFLANITHLITWPENNEPNFSICILNDNEVMLSLQSIYAGKTFNDKPVLIDELDPENTDAQCDILFIGKDTHASTVLAQSFSQEPTLTVSDIKSLSTEGIMITIFEENGRMTCTIDHKAAKEANIHLSYLLLESAYEVIE